MNIRQNFKRLAATALSAAVICGRTGFLPNTVMLNFSTPIIAEAAASDFTAEQAVAWAQARANEKWEKDVDGAYGCQCVDLTKAYYQYLGYSQPIANGYEYATISLPSGWTRVTSNPQPGDILCMKDSNSGKTNNGHVGIVTSVNGSSVTFVECRESGTIYAHTVKRDASKIFCFIRTNFKTASVPAVSHPNSATIKDGTYVVKNVGANMVMNYSYGNAIPKPVCITNGSEDANEQHFKFVHTGNGKYRVDILHADGGVLNCECNLPVTLGAELTGHSSSDNDTQRFYVNPMGDGTFILQSASVPEYALGVDSIVKWAHIKLVN